jgi:hypothetical protein
MSKQLRKTDRMRKEDDQTAKKTDMMRKEDEHTAKRDRQDEKGR